jgi:hypothetical protein
MPAEDWELSSGLREEVIFDIHLAVFGYRANYNNGATLLLILTGTDENSEVFEHILSVGGDWSAPDGKHASHPSGKSRINKSSRYGQWITACAQIPALWNYLQNSAGPTDASVWENLRLHLKAQNIIQTIRGESVNKDVLLPVEFLGFLETAQVAPPAFVQPTAPVLQAPSVVQPGLQSAPPSAMPVGAPAPVTPPSGPTPEQMLAAAQQQAGMAESPIRSQLRQMALAASDHNTFVGQAFAVQGVVADSALVRELMDPNDFYAKARTA